MQVNDKVRLVEYVKFYSFSLHYALSKLEKRRSNDYGRYFVAACDIPERTLILKENVLLHSPADDVNNKIAGKTLFCLVCCRASERCCRSCGWCICSADCEQVSNCFFLLIPSIHKRLCRCSATRMNVFFLLKIKLYFHLLTHGRF